MKLPILLSLSVLLLISCDKKIKTTQIPKAYLQEGSIELLDEELKQVLNPEGALEIISEGHDWTEGPVWIEKMQTLLFTDIPKNAVYSWSESNGSREYLKPSGFTGVDFKGSEPGANGLLLDPEGHLILCQHGDRRIVKMKSDLKDPKAHFEIVADKFEGKRFNSPNDAIYDSRGNLYFTDPPYGLPQQMEDPEKELDFQGVFKISPSGDVSLLDRDLSRPNGIGFSPDESVLYVANSDPDQAVWMAYDLDKEGHIISKKIFFEATEMVPKAKGLPDGLVVNKEGYLFATGPGGVYLFNPEGKHLGTIHTGQATSNVTLNADETILYITADSYVLKLGLQ